MDGEPEEPAPPQSRTRVWLIAAAVVVVLVLVGIVVAVTRGDSGPSKSSAVDACHQLVRDKLKAPATARFDADKPAKLNDGTGSDQGSLFILGTVDAENGFSANVRSSYVCVAHVQGDHYNIDPKDVILV